jgi:lipopolysaccharide/colanic/teichoic acid biosynthesis glycosyltransferase
MAGFLGRFSGYSFTRASAIAPHTLTSAPSSLAEVRYDFPPVAASVAKRAMDVGLASLAVVLMLPVLALIALAIVLDSGWPPLFVQERVGLYGRVFRLYKFRTMVNGAEAIRDELLARNEAPFPAFKVADDPRVTRLGRLLRRTSLDELPQLWNVIRGEMSLVGPRPPLPGEVMHYDANAHRRLRARPGLTCIWQIENRHHANVGFADWLEKDLRYIDTWTLRLDMALMLKTFRAVARMTGR